MEQIERWEVVVPVIAGVDWGRARVGVAFSDESGLMAHPSTVLPGGGPEDLGNALATLASSRGVATVVLGLPLHMNGSEGDSVAAVRRLGAVLEQKGFSVVFRDERLSSWRAETLLREGGRRGAKKKSRLDSTAAALILQGYLDDQRRA